MSSLGDPSDFAPTRWTLVLRARGGTPEARAALSELCAAYYQPVFRFLRHERGDEEVARELTQEFFATVLQRGDLGAADPARGRFRSYLLGAVKHFLADYRKRQNRLKRGGGAATESLDAREAESGEVLPDGGGEVPDAYFDREWAKVVMERALDVLAAEFAAAGRAAQYEQLKPWLAGEAPVARQTEAARQLGMNEGAVKVAIHRMRRRFREALRAETAQTLAVGDDVEAELRYLVEALTQN